MRIFFKWPRLREAYMVVLILCACFFLLRYKTKTKEEENSGLPVADFVLEQGVNNQDVHPLAGTHVPNELVIDAKTARLGRSEIPNVVEDKVYNGPFPDSETPEGTQLILMDYHNYTQQELDSRREGVGEQGVAAVVAPGHEQEVKRLYDANGFNGFISEQISIYRALKDIRHEKCASFRYAAKLPTVSVVIPFFEEHWTTLLRTIVSVVARSPKDLLKEIILVDDGSTVNELLKEPLEQWLEAHVPLARILRLPERQGLISARHLGLKAATADVLVVLDSHCEVMNDWLPPLLDPIVKNHRTAVCPLIDVINFETFGYTPQDNGGRGAFDWNFFYKRLPLREVDISRLPEPFPNPVMNGGLFAISRNFFWEVGGYDSGLAIWGGEQYDLSFKIWLCGGTLLDAPCSRVGHVFRGAPTTRPAAKKKNTLNTNYKRVALVWMDEFIEALYVRKPELRTLDAGDVSVELSVKQRLQCKPFKWFLETIAPDLVEAYPPFEPSDYANGTIRSVFMSGMCVDTFGMSRGELRLYSCHSGDTQRFSWCWRGTIRIPGDQFCWQPHNGKGKPPTMYNCFNNGPNLKSQRWQYNPVSQQLRNGESPLLCLEVVVETKRLSMEACVSGRTEQQWDFQHVDVTKILHDYPEFR